MCLFEKGFNTRFEDVTKDAFVVYTVSDLNRAQTGPFIPCDDSHPARVIWWWSNVEDAKFRGGVLHTQRDLGVHLQIKLTAHENVNSGGELCKWSPDCTCPAGI